MRKMKPRFGWLAVAVFVLAASMAAAPGALAYDRWTFVWDRQLTGVTDDLYGVDALDADHVWAVGTGGTILFHDGSNWSRQAAGLTVETLHEVSALDARHVWAVGTRGTVLFFDGSRWSAQPSGTTRALYGVHALSATHVWAVGAGGTIRHFDGSSWQGQASGVTEPLQSVAAADSTHVIAVGSNTRLFNNGFGWAPMGATTDDFLSVTTLNATSFWASGYGGRISYFNGLNWTSQANPLDAGVRVNGVSAANATNIWACASDGSVIVNDGADWVYHGDIYAEALLDISAADAGHVWAVGTGGAVFYGHKFEPGATNRDWATGSMSMPAAGEDWYLAEGSTGPGFVTYVEIANPQGADATVNITFMTDGGGLFVPPFVVPRHSRTTLNVADWADGLWGVSTWVRSSVPVVAERTMFSSDRTWAHNATGVRSADTTWYLAEGSTGPGFETWILVQNPSSEDADVRLTYMTPSGPVPGPSVPVGANTRRTLNVADTVPGEYSVSTLVTSDRPVIAERAMYGSGRTWAHGCAGLSTTGTNWYLAEGCTGPGFETWILVQNPTGEPVDVELLYLTGTGPVPGPSATLPPYSRRTFDVRETVRTWDVSTRVVASRPVIVERAMYGENRRWAHDSFGSTGAHTIRYLAEGETGSNTETWLTVQNPTTVTAHVSFYFMTNVGAGPVVTVDVPPQSRRTFNAGDYIAFYDFGVRAVSTRPVIIERSMYGQCPT